MGAQVSGPGGGSKFTIQQNADINVTPFVDVMLVLLIIFMVSAPLATVSIKLDLPPAIPSASKPPKPPTVVSLQKSGAIFVGPVQTSVDNVSADVAKALGGPNPQEQSVYIRADKQVRYGDFMAVMNTLQGNGFYQVALINEEI